MLGGGRSSCLSSCPLGAGGRLLWLVLCFRGVSTAFCPLCRFALVGLLANMALFRVLRAFIWVYRLFVWVCLSCVLCVREWLGGLKACGVFAPRFILLLCLLSFRFSLFLCVCPAFVLLSFVGLVAFRFPLFVLLFSLWVFVVSFSLTDYTQKRKGAKVLLLASSLRVLWVC